jgi:hypothetical protein
MGGSKMPRQNRDMPMAIPTGIAVRQPSVKAANTRNKLARKCCHNGFVVGRTGQVFVKLLESGLRGRQKNRLDPAHIGGHKPQHKERGNGDRGDERRWSPRREF